MSLAEVSNILWRERHLLEMLVFKLEEQQLLLAAGRSRWLTHAADELDRVLDELRHTEIIRAMEVDLVAADLGLPPGPALAALAAAVPEPWDGILAQHRDALVRLADEVRSLSATNTELLGRGAAAVRELLAAGPGSAAAQEAARGAGVLLDEVL